jgi:hypothetical protein
MTKKFNIQTEQKCRYCGRCEASLVKTPTATLQWNYECVCGARSPSAKIPSVAKKTWENTQPTQEQLKDPSTIYRVYIKTSPDGPAQYVQLCMGCLSLYTARTNVLLIEVPKTRYEQKICDWGCICTLGKKLKPTVHIEKEEDI